MRSYQRKKGNPLKDAARLKTIVGVFARYGFNHIAERAKLGRYILAKFSNPEVEEMSQPERVRSAFEELGPSFVKLGQLLATRPDLVPAEYVREFKKLHDQVLPIDFSKIKDVLTNHFGQNLEDIFTEINETPLAAASIAQVHKAKLKTGEDVVLKVQRPGIEEIIEEDIMVLYRLADLLEKYVPETRPYNPVAIVNEFFKVLEQETNFIVEANNIRRFQQNFADEPNIKIPKVYTALTGKRVLVMEALQGIPLSQKDALDQEGIDRETVLRVGLRCYLKMVFSDGLFHGDLHAGNLFVLPNNQIGLIDFGVVGRLNRKTQSAIANMLIALADEDYDRLAYEYIDLAPYTKHVDADIFAREIRDVIAPYYGLTLKHMNVGRLMMESTTIAARHGLVLPAELILYFKSIVTIEGMGRLISKDFDFLSASLEFASELVKSKFDPQKVVKDVALLTRDMNSLIFPLPRQLKQLFRKLNNPQFSFRVNIPQLDRTSRSIEQSSNLLFLGLVIAGLTIAGAMALNFEQGPFFLGLPLIAALSYGMALALSLLAFYKYIRK